MTACSTSKPKISDPEISVISERLKRLKLSELDGRPLDLERYLGKPVFLNFWATWCGPCKTELPEISAVSKAYSPDMIFLFASNEDPGKIQNFIEESGLNLHFIQLNMEYIDAFIIRLPTTFLIDKKGNLVAELEGYTIWDQPVFLNQLKQLVEE